MEAGAVRKPPLPLWALTGFLFGQRRHGQLKQGRTHDSPLRLRPLSVMPPLKSAALLFLPPEPPACR